MKLSELYGCDEGLAHTLGVENVWEEAGAICVNLPIGKGHLNHAQTVHGGTISALVDVAIGAYNRRHEIGAVALSSNVNYFRPAEPEGELVAAVCAKKRGKTVSVYAVTVTQAGRVIAEATVSTFQK